LYCLYAMAEAQFISHCRRSIEEFIQYFKDEIFENNCRKYLLPAEKEDEIDYIDAKNNDLIEYAIKLRGLLQFNNKDDAIKSYLKAVDIAQPVIMRMDYTLIETYLFLKGFIPQIAFKITEGDLSTLPECMRRIIN
jgi:hypothetical protein